MVGGELYVGWAFDDLRDGAFGVRDCGRPEITEGYANTIFHIEIYGFWTVDTAG